MGPSFLEAVYQECLGKEFIRQSIPFTAQMQLNLVYKSETLQQVYVPNFICYDKIIIEIPDCPQLSAILQPQTII